MKRILIIGMLLACGWAQAGLYIETFSPGTTVTAGSPVGTVFTGTVNDPAITGPVLSLTVDLNISGGYSGGFYISLTGPDGSTTVTLLNTPTTATPLGASFVISLADAGTAINSSVNFASGGTYQPSTALSGLNGQSANGNWSLYFADLASGGGNPTLNGWTLNINAVPEPINYALPLFGLIFIGATVGRFYLGRRRKLEAGS